MLHSLACFINLWDFCLYELTELSKNGLWLPPGSTNLPPACLSLIRETIRDDLCHWQMGSGSGLRLTFLDSSTWRTNDPKAPNDFSKQQVPILPPCMPNTMSSPLLDLTFTGNSWVTDSHVPLLTLPRQKPLYLATIQKSHCCWTWLQAPAAPCRERASSMPQPLLRLLLALTYCPSTPNIPQAVF